MQIRIQTNPYFCTYSIAVNDSSAGSGHQNRYSGCFKAQGNDNFLGTFWGAQKGLGAFLCDLKPWMSGSPLSKVSVLDVSHPLLASYCRTPKVTFEQSGRNTDQRRCLEFLSKLETRISEEIVRTDFQGLVERLRRFHEIQGGNTLLETCEIKICKSVQGAQFLEGVLDSDFQPGGLKVRDICRELGIILTLDDKAPVGVVQCTTPCIIILTEEEKKSLRRLEDGTLVFVESESKDLLEVFNCTFWTVKGTAALTERIVQYLDFFYFRHRFHEIWEAALKTLAQKELSDVETFLSLGLKTPAYLLDARAPKTTVNCLFRTTCKLVEPFDGEEGNASSIGELRVDSAVYDSACGEIRYEPTRIVDHKISITGTAENELYVYSGWSLEGKGANPYDLTVEVHDDGCATKVEIAPCASHFVEEREGSWFAAVGTPIVFEITTWCLQNGQYDPKRDPMVCSVRFNGNEVGFEAGSKTGTIQFCPPERGEVKVEVQTTRSGKRAACAVIVLPRADAIRVDVGVLPTARGGVCTVEHEDKETGLVLRDMGRRRVTRIYCFEKSGFRIVSRAVWNAVRDAPIWEGRGVCRLGVKSQRNDVLHVKDDCVFAASPGEETLRIACDAVDNPSEWEIVFTVLGDKSPFACCLMTITCACSVITTLVWYGLNWWAALLYSGGPIGAAWIYYHAESHLRTQRQKIGLFVTLGVSVFCLLKAIWEEIVG